MFAEELGSNANKRKQEEARARRRKLKQQQEQKKKTEELAQQRKAAAAAASATSSNGETKANIAVAPPVSVAKSAGSLFEAPTSADDTKNAAVKNALQQRQQRQAVQHQLKAITTIQSFYRAHRSNCKLLEHHTTLLGQRLQDLNTLTQLLKQRGQAEYVPPPATATVLCTQVSFLTKSLPYQSKRAQILTRLVTHAKKVQQLIELVLLPGINCEDENGNPFVVWMQSKQGQRRIAALIQLALATATLSGMESRTITTCLNFVQAIVGNASGKAVPPSVVVALGKKQLWSTSSIALPSPKKKDIKHPILNIKSSMDLISILRFHLLYQTGGSDPIPKAAEAARQSCIPAAAKNQVDALFRLVLSGLRSLDISGLYLRFVAEILTVPLLTWKIHDASVKLLIEPTRVSGKELPFLVSLLNTFINCHTSALNSGEVGSTLCNDLSLMACPATPTQSLLANLLQIAGVSPSLNGTQPSKMDFGASVTFYQFLATLVDAVPLATFSSRESVVEWISDGQGHHSPVVLSSVVMTQCRYLVVDAYVRRLFHCAIDDEALKIDIVLKKKKEKDVKQENDLKEAGVNAATLAAKEARVDRSKSFWSSAAWARRIKGVSKLLTTSSNETFGKGNSNLMDASSMSRQLAEGKTSVSTAAYEEKLVRIAYTPELLKTLCRLYGIILARWGGEGSRSCIRNTGALQRVDSNGAKQDIATATPDQSTQSLLNNFVFSTYLIKATWTLLQSDPDVVSSVYAIIDPHKGRIPVRSFSIHPQYGGTKDRPNLQSNSDGAALLYVFVSSLSRILIVTDDTEIHEMGKPLPLHQLRRCVQIFKQLLYRSCCLDDTMSTDDDVSEKVSHESKYFGYALISASARAMRDLYDRSSRRPLAVPKLWLIDDLLEKEIRRCKSKEDYVQLLEVPVLRVCPFLVSFKRRLKLFERIITTDRVSIQGENSQNPFNTNPLKPGIPIRITRGRILEDGLATMNHLGRNMRERLAVQYFNEAGMRETGIDAGGLFKEFWTDLCAIAFDPNYALFRMTEENCMYPNPSSGAAHGSDHITLFEFVGRILGKALYEGITVHPQFAHFFLSHIRGDYKYLNMLSDLSTMDATLYNNIMFLKNYDGDAEDLSLTFTVNVDDFGGNREIPLMPNGSNVEVTNTNKQRYIQLVAKYYVVDRIKEQAEAFTRGLREVIDRKWLEIFNEPELQVLISGASEGKLDVEDMRANCRYAGGFTGIDRTVNRFWNVVASMNGKQQADLLRFVTSCERPPPLGFASLIPPLTIQRVGILRDSDKLPSSSTCFNVLKLPTYSSEKVMRERLIYAIQSGAGFELT